RLLRPVHHRRACRPRRLAPRVLGACRADRRARGCGGAAAAEGARLRALRRARRRAQTDARPPAQPAPDCDLRDRLRRAVHLHVDFHLRELLSRGAPVQPVADLLGTLFVTYLAGVAVTPLSGRLVARFGRRPLAVGVIAVWIGGLMLSLIPALPFIVF